MANSFDQFDAPTGNAFDKFDKQSDSSILGTTGDLAKAYGNFLLNKGKNIAQGYGNLYYGLAKGLADPVYGVSQLGLHGANTAYHIANGDDPGQDNALQRLTNQYDNLIAQGERDYQGATPGSVPAGFGRFLGNIAPIVASLGATAPESAVIAAPAVKAAAQTLKQKVLQGIGTGALSAQSMPIFDTNNFGGYWGSKGVQGAVGAVLGGAIPLGSGLLTGLRNTLLPALSPRATTADQIARAVTQDTGVAPQIPATGVPPTPPTGGAVAQIPAMPQVSNLTGNRSIDDVLARIQNAKQYIQGSQPTTAQVVNTPALSMAEKTMFNNPANLIPMADRMNQNNAARIATLDNMAKTPEVVSSAIAERGAATKPIYNEAFAQPYTLDSALENLINRPSGQSAIARGKLIAAESGQPFVLNPTVPATPPVQTVRMNALKVPETITTPGTPAVPGTIDGQALQYLKLGIQNLQSDVKRNGIAGLDDKAVANTASDLHNWLLTNAPKYKEADALYSSMSKPINDMQVAQAVKNALGLNLTDILANDAGQLGMRKSMNTGGDTQLTLNNFQAAVKKALNGEDGHYGTTPEGAKILDSIGADLQRQSSGASAVPKVGSDSVYNFQAPNWLAGKLYGGDLSGKASALPGAVAVATGLLTTLAGHPMLGAGAAGGAYAGAKGVTNFIGGRLNNQMQDALLNPEVFGQLLREGLARRAAEQQAGLLSPALGQGASLLAGSRLGQ